MAFWRIDLWCFDGHICGWLAVNLQRYLDAIRNVAERNEVQAWQDEISGYPVYIVDGKEQTVIPQIGDKNAPLDTRVKDGADDTDDEYLTDGHAP